MDFSFITDFFNSTTGFFQYLWDWLTNGIYQLIKETFVFLTKVMIYSYLKSLIFLVDVAYEVVGDISADLGVTAKAQAAYNSIPQAQRSVLDFFGVPQALTIILSAIPTRMAMRFVPFIGR
jgi:E3 ubiquitin-protein ligase DOA10